jgi:NDP-sugar pyrophosphorylase family protein
MRAVVICSGPNPALHGLDDHQPAALLPLCDRPFLQHVVEYLALSGAREFEFILSHAPEKVESFLGDGARWGCRFTYHLVASPQHSWRMLRNICGGLVGRVILAQADGLPVFDNFQHLIAGGSSILCTGAGEKAVWSGWACFEAASAPLLFPSDAPDSITTHLMECAQSREISAVTVDTWINCQTPEGILESQMLHLRGEATGLMLNGNQAEKGICIGHGASIHPTARLVAPLYIGPNSRIGAGVTLGPGAVVSENCIIDDDTIMVNSLTTAGTYIGQGLELDGVLVDRNRLVSARLGTACLISESFLAGSLSGPLPVPFLRGLSDRVIALVLYFVTLPLLLIMFLRSKLGPDIALKRAEFLRLPSSEDPRAFAVSKMPAFVNRHALISSRWQHFIYRFVPGLIAVVRGRLNLVGVPPRSAQDVEAMPVDWRSVYLACKAGLITESLVVYGLNPTIDEAYSADAFYRAMESPAYDCRLVVRYLVQVLFEPGKQLDSEMVTDCEAK